MLVTNGNNSKIYARLDNITFKKEIPSGVFLDSYSMDNVKEDTPEFKKFKEDYWAVVEAMQPEDSIYIRIQEDCRSQIDSSSPIVDIAGVCNK